MRTLRRLLSASMVVWLGTLALVSAIRAADSKLLPDDTEVVFSINVRQILDSELVKANKDAMDQAKTALDNEAGDNPAMKYLKSAGFDLFRDLDGITVAGNGGQEPAVYIIRGNFDPDKFAAAARQAAKDNPDMVKITTSAGRTVYEFKSPAGKTDFAQLVGGKALVASSTAAGLRDQLERLAGSKKSKLKKEFAVLQGTVNDRQSINFVATGAALARLAQNEQVPNRKMVAEALKNIDGLSGALTVGKEVRFELGINAKNEAGAKKMAQDGTSMILGFQFLLNLQAAKDEKLAPLVDAVKTLRITTRGSNVLLRGTVSFDVVARLMKSLNQ